MGRVWIDARFVFDEMCERLWDALYVFDEMSEMSNLIETFVLVWDLKGMVEFYRGRNGLVMRSFGDVLLVSVMGNCWHC
ncbi:hypothetical protein Csa_018194 [Cucumis sativus]|nr:hypothetical protein Csa_018194 [Cucumis sativus]